MATRIAEMDTLSDLLTPVGVQRFFKEEFPKKYVKNTIGIRSQPTTPTSLTATLYNVSNTYQIVYFGESLTDCLNKSELINDIIADKMGLKIKVTGANEYISLVSFSISSSFKTDTDGVYAISALLVVRSNRHRTRIDHEKMEVITTNINGGGN